MIIKGRESMCGGDGWAIYQAQGWDWSMHAKLKCQIDKRKFSVKNLPTLSEVR